MGGRLPRRSKGARLYRDPKRGQFVIRDGGRFIRVGTGDAAAAEKILAAYIAKKHSPDATSTAPLIADVLNAYAADIVPGKATASNISYNLGNLLRWWGAKTTQEITARNSRAYVDTKSQSGAAADLKFLRAACNHWSREYTQLVPQPVVWRPAESRPRERWLTKSEAARLLWAARRYQHIKRLVLLGLYTGSRPGVILRLQWDQIDLSAGVMARIRPGEAAHANKRSPNVRLGKRILSHLRRWARLDAGTVSYLCHYDGQRVVDPHTAWRKTVKAAGLKGVTPHTLRHTRATWLMQAGIGLWEAASALGMTVRTLEKVYGHHSADYQERAANV